MLTDLPQKPLNYNSARLTSGKMPALIDDPASPAVYRQSGLAPFLEHDSPLPTTITPRTVTLRDGTTSTIVPFSSVSQVPPGLIKCLSDLLNREIEAGDTYPMLDPIPLEKFGPYWFANFAVVALKGGLEEVTLMLKGETKVQWDEVALGTHYIKVFCCVLLLQEGRVWL